MRTTLRHAAWSAAALAVLFLALSAESCQNGTVTTTSGGTKTITITDRSNFVSVAPGMAQSATASCQAGEVMLSGGYATTTPAYTALLNPSDPLNRYVVFADFPASTSSWTASVLNRASGDEAGAIILTAHVECASGLSGAPTIGQGGGNAFGQPAYAHCTAPMLLTGGGYQITPPPMGNAVVAIDTSAGVYPIQGGNQDSYWDVEASPAKGSSADLSQTSVTAFSVCVSRTTVAGFNTSVKAPLSTINGQPTSGIGSVGCPAGQLLSGAGFKLTPITSSLVVTTFYPNYTAPPPQWNMTLYSLPQPSGFGVSANTGGSATVIPICMSVG